MANPIPHEITSAENGEIGVPLEFVVGSTGAVGAVTATYETKTPVRNGVGDYTVPLREAWLRCTDGHAFAVGDFVAGEGTAAKMYDDSSANVSAPSVSFQFYRTDTGVAAEVETGDIVKIRLTLKRY